MGKKNTFRKNMRNKKRTRKNLKKRFKGGFNSIQLAGAIAVAGLLGKNKLVFIRKPESRGVNNRYEFILEGTRPRLVSNRSKIEISKGVYIAINNFNIYVGSTEDDILIQITGNDAVAER